jgi:hypothetical protein
MLLSSLGIRSVAANLIVFSRCHPDYDLPGRQTHAQVKYPLLMAYNLTKVVVFDVREIRSSTPRTYQDVFTSLIRHIWSAQVHLKRRS